MKTSKIVIGLVGETGGGKDTVAHYLKRKYGAHDLRFSLPMKKALKFFFERPKKIDQAWFYQVLKERFGEEILHLGIKRFIDQHTGIMCINGLRMPNDLKFVRSFEKGYVIYITANQKLRWERTYSRGEKADDEQTFEEFQKFEATAETEKAVPEIGAKADFKILNETTMDDLLRQVDEAMKEILTTQI
jgi:dephospho-CoA kinase